MGTHKTRLFETILMSTHNVGFGKELIDLECCFSPLICISAIDSLSTRVHGVTDKKNNTAMEKHRPRSAKTLSCGDKGEGRH